MSKYVAGAGISGLLWGYYHSDYTIVTDDFGRVVTGAEPVVWLNDTDLTRKLLDDLGIQVKPVKKPIGYKSSTYVMTRDQLTLEHLDNVLIKKMMPWEALEAAAYAGIEVKVNTPSKNLTKNSSEIRFLNVDMKDVVVRLAEAVKFRVKTGMRISGLTAATMTIGIDVWKFERLVSTLPAPIFKRLWGGQPELPPLHYCPVSYVVSERPPTWWQDRYAMIYDADLNSPISRVGRFGDTWRYEFTGRPDNDTLNEYMPVTNGRFVNLFGRIVQDVKLESPSERITFLGRIAEWDYTGLIDRVLERVHGRR